MSPKRLTAESIAKARSDDKLHALLAGELKRVLGSGSTGISLDEWVSRLAALPAGLRALAATYELDVSITLDGLADHFANWPHLGLAEATLQGLHELEAHDIAAIFAEALDIARANWELFGANYPDGFRGTPAEALLDALDDRAWAAFGLRSASGKSILAYWPEYVRAHPERVCGAA